MSGQVKHSLCELHGFQGVTLYFKQAILTIHRLRVRVVRIVVVQGAVRVHVTHVVRVPGVRRPQEPVTSGLQCLT